MDSQKHAMASDAEQVRRVLAGDADAFEPLLIKYKGYVLTIVGRHIPRRLAEEVAQDAFIRAYLSLNSLKKKQRFKYWLSAITHRTCYDFWRKQYRMNEIPFSHLSKEQAHWLDKRLAAVSNENWERQSGQKEAAALLAVLLEKLNPAERMIMEMVYLEGRSIKVTADLIGWSEVNVRVRAFRIRQKLKKWAKNMR